MKNKQLATANRSRDSIRSQPCKTFLTSSLDHHAKFGCCFCAHVGEPKKFLGCCGVDDPLEARSCPTCYCSKFCRSRSNRSGIGGTQKNLETGLTCILAGALFPPSNVLLPICVTVKFCHSKLNCTSVIKEICHQVCPPPSLTACHCHRTIFSLQSFQITRHRIVLYQK